MQGEPDHPVAFFGRKSATTTMRSVDESDVLVAIPALNETATVAAVVAAVRDALPRATVLVVDDGSTDDTASVSAAAGAQVLVLPFNVGVGGAMRAAFLFAQDRGAKAVVQVDADGQHDPAQISRLLAGLAEADIVIGARFAGKGEYQVRGPRRWAMKVLSRSLSRVVGTKLTDTTSGFRASGTAAIDLFARQYPSQYLGDTVESLVIAARSGLQVQQVSVEMKPRQGGLPSHSPTKAGLYLARAALALFVALSRRADVSSVR